MSCPHCVSLMFGNLTCCVCAGEQRVTHDAGVEAARNAWSREGCECGACALIRRLERKR